MEDYHRGIFMHLLFVEPCTPFLTFPPCVHLSLCSLCPPIHTPFLPSSPSFIFLYRYSLCVSYIYSRSPPYWFLLYMHFPVYLISSPPTGPYTPLYTTTHLIFIFFPTQLWPAFNNTCKLLSKNNETPIFWILHWSRWHSWKSLI